PRWSIRLELRLLHPTRMFWHLHGSYNNRCGHITNTALDERYKLLRRKNELAASKVCKRAVCFCHLVSVFLLFEGCTGFVVGINDFHSQTLCVWDTLTSTCRLY